MNGEKPKVGDSKSRTRDDAWSPTLGRVLGNGGQRSTTFGMNHWPLGMHQWMRSAVLPISNAMSLALSPPPQMTTVLPAYSGRTAFTAALCRIGPEKPVKRESAETSF